MEVVLPPASTKKMHQKEDRTCIQLPVNGAVRSLRQSVPMSLPNQLLPFCLLLKKSRYGLVRQVLFLRMFGPLFHRQSTVWLHRWMGRVMLKKTLITIGKKVITVNGHEPLSIQLRCFNSLIKQAAGPFSCFSHQHNLNCSFYCAVSCNFTLPILDTLQTKLNC